jgi:hypothetical protein
MNRLGVPETEEVWRDGVPESGDARQHVAVVEPEARPAVQEDDARPRADAYVVHPPAA